VAAFDARPVIAAGGQPFNDITSAVPTLGDGERLVVLAPFEPLPLEAVMKSRGFSNRAAGLGDRDWRVTFRRVS
jgi:hypothetical protein